MKTVGVLALQGAFRRHVERLEACGASAPEIRTAAQLHGLDAIIIPGGESTTMSMMLERNGLAEPLGDALRSGLPVFGTCAGLILLASRVTDGRPDQLSYGLLDISVQRNGYGRQVSSFEADLPFVQTQEVAGIQNPEEPFRAVFIRAPRVLSAGPSVSVLAEVDSDPVLMRTGAVWGAVFHPELTEDARLHNAFLAAL